MFNVKMKVESLTCKITYLFISVIESSYRVVVNGNTEGLLQALIGLDRVNKLSKLLPFFPSILTILLSYCFPMSQMPLYPYISTPNEIRTVAKNLNYIFLCKYASSTSKMQRQYCNSNMDHVTLEEIVSIMFSTYVDMT